ncbi:hypothetical protein [Cohnella terricola]|uniref:Uncharacterized protein n=1 Tax=Cohnella terricola TaxID=1289167 RepID=A0A559JQV2_9BACL|nr:hypothetical protein [Cohnella terricola]TVY02256.1 hypothetical protein FPZ45_07420 [Cohnella terricola]
MSESVFHQFMRAESEELEQSLIAKINSGGYSAFYEWIEDFRDGLKIYSEDRIPHYQRKLARARELFPEPQRLSPSWSGIWDEFELIFACKNEVLAAIPEDKREGEWQILLDNPYSHQQVVCYPGLSFLEAAYLYGYFQRELKPNEVLRLQKIAELISVNGRKDLSLLPEA